MSKYTESIYQNILFSAYSCAVITDEKPTQTSFLEEMENIQNGDYKKEAERARWKKANESEAEYKKYKKTSVWCFTPGVNNSQISKANPLPTDYTGLLTLDVDDLSQDQNRNKEILLTFPWVIAISKSIGGEGLFAIIKCDKDRLQDSYDSAIQILAEQGVWAAGGQHNANRLRFASYDPDIYYNKAPGLAPVVPIIARKAAQSPQSTTQVLSPNNSAYEHIFKSVLKEKEAADPKIWEKDHRHDNLVSIAGSCNTYGVPEKEFTELVDQYIKPLIADSKDYPVHENIKDTYKRWEKQFNTGDWKKKYPFVEAIPMNRLEDFEKYRITKEKTVPETPAMITIGTARVAAACNITPITAEAKAGKTAATSVFLAGAISKTGEIDGFTDVQIASNPAGKAVIHFDTEQSEADQQYNLKTVLKRCSLLITPDYYLSYNIRTLALNQYEDFTNAVCRLANEKFSGIHLIVIDGAADFITSINDEAEANAIILFFTQLAVTYQCPVIMVIHLNENAGKNGDTMPRGHVGRQAVRKGYAQLNIVKDGDVSVMQALRARKAGNADTPLVAFKYNPDKGYHTAIDSATLKEEKEDKKKDMKILKWQSIAQKAMPPTGSLSYVDVVNKLAKVSGTEYENGRKLLKNMVAHGILSQGDDENYRLGKVG